MYTYIARQATETHYEKEPRRQRWRYLRYARAKLEYADVRAYSRFTDLSRNSTSSGKLERPVGRC